MRNIIKIILSHVFGYIRYTQRIPMALFFVFLGSFLLMGLAAYRLEAPIIFLLDLYLKGEDRVITPDEALRLYAVASLIFYIVGTLLRMSLEFVLKKKIHFDFAKKTFIALIIIVGFFILLSAMVIFTNEAADKAGLVGVFFTFSVLTILACIYSFVVDAITSFIEKLVIEMFDHFKSSRAT